MRLSRILAVVIGVLAAGGETVRRWGTWREFPPSLFDDYFLMALMFSGAWLARSGSRRGQCILAAAWGFFCGVAASSFLGQLHRLQMGEPDPAPISSAWVAVIKGAGCALGIVALAVTVLARPERMGTGTGTGQEPYRHSDSQRGRSS